MPLLLHHRSKRLCELVLPYALPLSVSISLGFPCLLMRSPRICLTTDIVRHILGDLINKHGKPREILTDNGSAYGSTSSHSRFDRWCNRRGIHHIRTKVHSPQTSGKVERLFKTMDEEMKFCKNDLERFRLRYNHFRPHSSLSGKKPAEVYFDFSSLF